MPDGPRNDKLMRLYLLAVVILIVPIALNYGLVPGTSLPMTLDIKVEGTDQTHIFRALMCLYLGGDLLGDRRLQSILATHGGDLGRLFCLFAGGGAGDQPYCGRTAQPASRRLSGD